METQQATPTEQEITTKELNYFKNNGFKASGNNTKFTKEISQMVNINGVNKVVGTSKIEINYIGNASEIKDNKEIPTYEQFEIFVDGQSDGSVLVFIDGNDTLSDFIRS